MTYYTLFMIQNPLFVNYMTQNPLFYGSWATVEKTVGEHDPWSWETSSEMQSQELS